MKVEVSSKELTEALKNLQTVSTNNVDTLIVDGISSDTLAITAFDNEREAVVYVPAKIKNKGIFYIDPNVFTPLVKNRGDLVLQFEGNLEVSQARGNYKVEGVPLKGGARQTPKFPKSDITDKLAKRIQDAISKILIKQVTTEDIYFGMGLKDDKLIIGVVDQFHAAVGELILTPKEIKEVAGFNNVVIPLKYADMIPKIPGNASISITDSNVTYFSDSFMVNLPSLAIRTINILDIHEELFPMFKGKSSIDVDKLKDFMSNIQSVIDPLVVVEMEIRKGDMSLSYKTTKGVFSDSCTCKTENKGSLKVDAYNLNDIMKKASGLAKIAWNDYGIGFMKIEEGLRSAYFSNLRA